MSATAPHRPQPAASATSHSTRSLRTCLTTSKPIQSAKAAAAATAAPRRDSRSTRSRPQTQHGGRRSSAFLVLAHAARALADDAQHLAAVRECCFRIVASSFVRQLAFELEVARVTFVAQLAARECGGDRAAGLARVRAVTEAAGCAPG